MMNEMRKLMEAVDFGSSEYETAINILVKHVYKIPADDEQTPPYDSSDIGAIINQISLDIDDRIE